MTQHRCCRDFAVAVNFEHLRWWPDGAQYVVEVGGRKILTHVCFCPFCGTKLYRPDAAAHGEDESLPGESTANESPAAVCVRLLLELHRLSLEGKGNSSQADAACAAMEAPWEAMSEPDQERMGSLCERLYAIEQEVIRLRVPVSQGLACVACGAWDPTSGGPVRSYRTAAGFTLHKPTCGHDAYLTCPACSDSPHACPRCGCTAEKT